MNVNGSPHPQPSPTMRCISNEGVDFSQLAQQHSPSLSRGKHHVSPDDVTVMNADVTSSSPRAPVTAVPDLKSLTLSDTSSATSSPQLSPMSTTSESDLTLVESPVSKDLPAMLSSIPPRLLHSGQQQQFSFTSSPDLSTLPENCSKRSSSGISSSSSLSVNGDSGSDSSRASTARNTLSGSSSLSTLPDEHSSRAVSSTEIRSSTSESQLLEKNSTTNMSRSRRIFEGRVWSQESIYDPSTKRPDLSILQRMRKVGTIDQESHPSIQLPERYRHALRKSGSYGNVVSVSRKSSGSCEQGQDLTSREKDLGTALAWIRHEMVQMKEQDKVLLKRFIELRANILHLRCMYGSASDICSMDGSTVSLNEMRKPTRMRSTDSDVTLSGGLYSATSSLSLPCSPQLSRLRWRSDDFM
ncbi:hypothetical protein ACOMHN_025362 [Nucella lapillus]